MVHFIQTFLTFLILAASLNTVSAQFEGDSQGSIFDSFTNLPVATLEKAMLNEAQTTELPLATEGPIESNSLELDPERCPVIPENRFFKDNIYRHLIYKDYRIVFKIHVNIIYIMRIFHGAKLLEISDTNGS